MDPSVRATVVARGLVESALLRAAAHEVADAAAAPWAGPASEAFRDRARRLSRELSLAAEELEQAARAVGALP